MSNKIADLQPDTQIKAELAIEKMRSDVELKKMGVTGIYVSETLRTLATQMAYYSRSRMSVSDVKKMYAAAGLYKISDEEAAKANTWTLSSKHIEGKAIDLVPEINGVILWTAPDSVWQRMGEIGKTCGLTWGGDWSGTPDKPHFQEDKI